MKRRTFVAAGLAVLATTSLRSRRALGAAASVDLNARRLDGAQLTLKGADVDDLRAGLRGELIAPGQPGYDRARRLWNPAFDLHPALVARCLGAADVKRAVSFAAANGLLTAVRGGGHSFSGQSGCDGGLVIDLSPMRAVEVDPTTRRARVAGGALLGHLDREALAFGLATPAGVVADTGVAGLTLGGGIGRLGRKLGLSCDNLSGAEVITADGSWLRVSDKDNADLLWGLRGGGGNFGVVTQFVFELHEVGRQLYGGALSFAVDDLRPVLRGFADFMASAPDEVYAHVNLEGGEPGKRLTRFNVSYAGSAQDGERVLAPLRKLAKPHSDTLAAASYTELQGSNDLPGVASDAIYLKGGLVGGLTPALIDALAGCLDSTRLDSVEIGFQTLGGAIARAAPDSSAFWNRTAAYSMHVVSGWKPDADHDTIARNKEWVRHSFEKLEPLTHGRYVNIAGGDQQDSRVSAAYGDNYPRLAALKKRYDPTNLFRLNANIKPA